MPIAAIFLGAYLLLVVAKGNSKGLLSEISKSTGFVKWLIALAVLMWLGKTKTFGPAVVPLLGIAGVAFALNSLPQLQAQFSQAWQSLDTKG